MALIRKIVCVLLVGILLGWTGVSGALAEGFRADQRQALSERIETFHQRFRSGDVLALAEMMPPKVLAEIARRFGGSPEETHADMLASMRETFSQVRYDHFLIDEANGEEAETGDGTAYLLLPTVTRVVDLADGRAARMEAHILAFIDEGEWVLINVGSEGIGEVVEAAYPQFTGVSFPTENVVMED